MVELTELWDIIGNLQYSKFKEFIEADKITSQESFIETSANPKAIHTSRFMSFTNLSKPINSTGIQIDDPEGNFSCIYSFYIYLFANFFRDFLFQFQIHN